MDSNLKLWPAVSVILLLVLLTLCVAYFSKSPWLTLSVAATVTVASAVIVISSIRASQTLAVIGRLQKAQDPKENSTAFRFLAEFTTAGSEKKLFAVRASELMRERFQLGKFVILFRENDRYFPRIYAGFDKDDLAVPGVQKVVRSLGGDPQAGVVSNDENLWRLVCRNDRPHNLSVTAAFAYSWGRSRSVFIVADDRTGSLSEVLKDPEFNRIFWPRLEYDLKLNLRLFEKSLESKQAVHELEQVKKDLVNINRELKNKLLDLQSFVKISNDLYSLFNEEQLFSTLRETVCAQLGASRADILVPSGEGKFVLKASSAGTKDTLAELVLDVESELSGLLAKSPRPLLLPLVGSGLKRNEPFLSAALSAGIQVASTIRVAGQTACILLVAEKNDKAQYTNLDVDFLYIISNIASLALDNIHQYTTIEKLSYTDSMTGIFNYRYFYKRLNEEVLRARRYSRELSLVILDIDNFKSFNDNYGHQAGDLVLKQLSDLVTKSIRSIDVVSRYGGEEFCIIMPDTGISNCKAFIERLRSQISDFKFESELLQKGSAISVSVGGAVYPHHASTPDRLIYCADMALLKAKSLGRNRAIMFEQEPAGEANPAKGSFDESRRESVS